MNHPPITKDYFHIGFAESDVVLVTTADGQKTKAQWVVNYEIGTGVASYGWMHECGLPLNNVVSWEEIK